LGSFEVELLGVVNAAAVDVQYTLPDDLQYHALFLEDSPNAKLLPLLDGAVDFIANIIDKGGACFVHCKGGMSRSASIVIAYLMKHRGLSFDVATQVTRHGRPNIDPNFGFRRELQKFEEQCRKDPRAPRAG